MGNVQSEIISDDNGINDYDPKGAVIPDINPWELLRTSLRLEKIERCLSCVPLTIDPRSPESHVGKRGDNGAKSKFPGASKGGKGGNEKNDVDVMSTIEEGDDDDDESTAFTIEGKQQRQRQQQQHGNKSDAWMPAKITEDDPSASLWHSPDAFQQYNINSNQVRGVNKSKSSNGSYDFTEFNPDKIVDEGGGEGEFESAEYTEFDPDAILAAEQQQQQHLHQQQKNSSGLRNELDDVIMMRSDDDSNFDNVDNDLGDLFQDSNSEPSRKSPNEPFDDPFGEHIIGLTDPMDAAQRACDALSPTNATNLRESYQFMNELDDVAHFVDDSNEYDQEENSPTSISDLQEEMGSTSGPNHCDWAKENESGMHHMEWRDNHQLEITTDVDDANKIANKRFDEIISDFELSPQHPQREKAYSDVRSWKTQRAQKERRNRRMSETHSDDEITKKIYSPATSEIAFFAEQTTVGRKLNGISPKVAFVCESEDYDASPSDGMDKNAASVTQRTNNILKLVADVVQQDQENDDHFSYSDEGMDEIVGDSLADASIAELDECPSYHGDESGTNMYAKNKIAIDRVKSVGAAEKIKYDVIAKSTSASSTFEATHAKLKGLLAKASYESDSINDNDSVNWDNLDYSMSDGSTMNNKSCEYALDHGEAAGQSQEVAYHQSLQSEDEYGDQENVTPTHTTKQMEDKINQMKKQHEDDMKSHVNRSHNSPRHLRLIETQRRIDAMREQHKTSIDDMLTVMKKTDVHRKSSSSSSRFTFDDKVISKIDAREKSIRELMKQNAKLEEEMRQIRALSPRSPSSSKFSPASTTSSNAFSPISSERKNRRRYSPRSGFPRSPSSSKFSPKSTTSSNSFSPVSNTRKNRRRYSPRRGSPTSHEAREALSTMILDANADEEKMNIRVNGMIADIKSFLRENEKVQELEGILSSE
jgi:hypothetical protein